MFEILNAISQLVKYGDVCFFYFIFPYFTWGVYFFFLERVGYYEGRYFREEL